MIKQGSVYGHRNAGAGQTGRTTENEIIDPMVTGRNFPKNQKTGKYQYLIKPDRKPVSFYFPDIFTLCGGNGGIRN